MGGYIYLRFCFRGSGLKLFPTLSEITCRKRRRMPPLWVCLFFWTGTEGRSLVGTELMKATLEMPIKEAMPMGIAISSCNSFKITSIIFRNSIVKLHSLKKWINTLTTFTFALTSRLRLKWCKLGNILFQRFYEIRSRLNWHVGNKIQYNNRTNGETPLRFCYV